MAGNKESLVAVTRGRSEYDLFVLLQDGLVCLSEPSSRKELAHLLGAWMSTGDFIKVSMVDAAKFSRTIRAGKGPRSHAVVTNTIRLRFDGSSTEVIKVTVT